MQGSDKLANDVMWEFKHKHKSSLNRFCKETLNKETSYVLRVLRGKGYYANGEAATGIRVQVVTAAFPNGYPVSIGSNDESMD